MKRRQMVAVLTWDEDMLGPEWMNPDNLEQLLYGVTSTSRKALQVKCFKTLEAPTAAEAASLGAA